MAGQVLDIISSMRSAFSELRGTFGAEAVIGEADKMLETLADRFNHPYEPLVVAICGPTGAGKSHLVNFLAGGAVSPSSYRRPSTTAPVAVGHPVLLKNLNSGFLAAYDRVEAPEGVVFAKDSSDISKVPGDRVEPAEKQGRQKLYLTPIKEPSWVWPENLLIIDTPDFDSVRLENQLQAADMARRADAVILVAHQAKYADQSTWDFLEKWVSGDEKYSRAPLLIILNRLTDQAAADDFKDRLRAAGNEYRVLAWPEEMAVGQVAIKAARNELTGWLTEIGQRGGDLVAENGRRQVARLKRLVDNQLWPPFNSRREFLEAALIGTAKVTQQWMERPSDRLASNLPEETREKILKGLSEVVSRSDLWAKPRRWLAVPFEAVESGFKRIFGKNPGVETAERKLADSLTEAGREALVAAVRSEARALAEAAGLPSPQADLDFTPEEIREEYRSMTESRDAWLKEEIERLLKDLPLGKKAAFYFVQAAHLGVVGSLLIQTGGIPGTETLVSGALGPLISKIAGAIISKDTLVDFEARASVRHQRDLAEIFERQGQRYQARLKTELDEMEPGLQLKEELRAIEEEAVHLWA